MRWLRISDYAIKSEDGRYRVCKVIVNGVPLYELWAGRERIGGWGTAEAAKSRASAGGTEGRASVG